jgi:hypothetical protein
MMPVSTLNYGTGPRRRDRPFTVVHMTIWLAIVSITYLGLFCWVLPRFDQIFKDFKTSLPAVTWLYLLASRICRNDFGWLVPALIPLLPLAVDHFNGNRWTVNGVSRRTRILFATFMALAVLGLVFAVFAMFSPMIALISAVSSPPRAPVTPPPAQTAAPAAHH